MTTPLSLASAKRLVTAQKPRSRGRSQGNFGLGRRGAVRAAARYRAGGRRRILADPLVLPRLVVLLGVALRLVDRHQLAGYLLPVRAAAAQHLICADGHLPP